MHKGNEATGFPVAPPNRPLENGRFLGLSKHGLCHTDSRIPDCIPVYKFGPNSLVQYWERIKPKGGEATTPPEDSRAKGQISATAHREVKRLINAWSFNQKMLHRDGRVERGKLIIATLTLPAMQKHSDTDIKRKPFRAFIQWLINNGYKNWLWRAEVQENDNLHFHLILDKYLDKDVLRDKWNALLEKFGGYVSEFESKYEHRDPNSTDIHEARYESNVEEYCAKYCAKEDDQKEDGTPKRSIEGRVWGRSESITKFKKIVVQETQEVEKLTTYLDNEASKVVEEEHYKVWLAELVPLIHREFPLLYQELESECIKQRELSNEVVVNPP
jgi:hypothetical protein